MRNLGDREREAVRAPHRLGMVQREIRTECDESATALLHPLDDVAQNDRESADHQKDAEEPAERPQPVGERQHDRDEEDRDDHDAHGAQASQR